VVVLALSSVGALVWVGADLWSRRLPLLKPRHRAEALCFALASPPAFAPAIRIEPGSALVPGNFPPGTPPGIAVREVMHLDESMVVGEQSQRVGDYDVAVLWLRLPDVQTGRHWMVVGWMEHSDLAMCSFRFVSDADDLPPEAEEWGRTLLGRILVPEYFVAGVLPDVRLRAGALPAFGPRI
jgi:hypothetical protein